MIVLAQGVEEFGPKFDEGSAAAMDGFALAMVALIIPVLGLFALWIFLMARRAGKIEPEQELIEELAREKRKEAKAAAGEKAEPQEGWERKADWWKNVDGS